MKFCTRFEDDLQEVGWEDNYLRYRELKEMIKLFTVNENSSIDTVSSPTYKRTPSESDSDLEYSEILSSCSDRIEEDDRSRDCAYSSESASDRPNIFDDLDEDIINEGEGSYLSLFLRKFAKTLPEVEKENDAKALLKELDVCIVRDVPFSEGLEFFEKVLHQEVVRIEQFVRATMDELTLLYEFSLQKDMIDLLRSSKEKMNGMEYIMRLSIPDMKILTTFGIWVDTIHALERFIIINMQAVRKIVKKFNKYSLFKSGKMNSRKLNDARSLDRLSQSLDAVETLKRSGVELDVKMMCTSSCYHDYHHDHLKQLDTHRRVEKLWRHERQKKFSTRVTKMIDLETQIMPSFLLLVGVFLVIFTMFCTYYISLGIYVDEERSTTIFDEKGYFISASIDRAPAANVGSLGLNLSLALLAVVIFVKHKTVKKQLRGKVWMRTHRIACALGMGGIICGMGVAAFQHQDLPVTHNIFAACFFTFAMLHVLLETMVDIKHKLSSSFLRKFRFVTASLITICVLLFIGPMAYLIGICGGHKCPQRDDIRFFAAIFEISAFFLLILWFASYYPLFRKLQFQLHVHRKVEVDIYQEVEVSTVNSCGIDTVRCLNMFKKQEHEKIY